VTRDPRNHTQPLWTRRDFGLAGLTSLLVSSVSPRAFGAARMNGTAWRVVNIMNFIRAEEPREPMDLMQPVQGQMALIKEHHFPATWLLQYDAMVEGPFAAFLKKEMPTDHETGIWFEMNRKICDDAGIAWRGKPDWEWDYHVPIAYPIGYKPDERRRLADTAMKTHKRVFGRDAKTVASWNLDAVTVAHFADEHGVDAFGNCRDQLATDGFTVWGAPIAAYYPSRENAWSPAVNPANQIHAPIFRLLGQDPVYYYDKTLSYPDTMEPAWPSGQSEVFVDHFLDMMKHGPTQALAYTQLGQENSFGWPATKVAYAMQMAKLAEARQHGLTIETMGSTGRRFKQSFKMTPTQAQVMLSDPFDKEVPERSIWYQSKYYRANLHFRGDAFYLRDLHVYSDRFPQPYLAEPVTSHGIEQRLLAVMDGYHWSDDEVRAGLTGKRAMARFISVDENQQQTPLTFAGVPSVKESRATLEARVPVSSGGKLLCIFNERDIRIRFISTGSARRLGIAFEWSQKHSAFISSSADEIKYSFRSHDYSVRLAGATASTTPDGVLLLANGSAGIQLLMAQAE
jgi:hypothetical protein